jgi:hypothetical protein
MKQDPIITEIRRVRDRLAARFNYDVKAIVAHYQRMERESGATYVHRGPKLVKKPALKSK